MLKSKVLRLQIAGVAALALLFASSAFAESRHFGGTHGGSSHSFSHGSVGHSAPSRSFGFFRGSMGRSAPSRSFGFSRGSMGRSAPSRSFGSRSYSGRSRSVAPRVAPSWRGGSSNRGYSNRGYSNRGYSYGSAVPFRGYNSGSRFFGRGRITRVVPFRGGYNVFLGGWGYPFFVPYRFWDPLRFRIGVFVGFNAFYDPLGYYDVYDPWYYPYPPPYAYYPPAEVYSYPDGSNDDSGQYEYGSSVVRGTVQNADISRDTMWVNDETTKKVVTVLMPPDRALDRVRAGDYVEISGEWKSDGVFDGHALDRYTPRGQ